MAHGYLVAEVEWSNSNASYALDVLASAGEAIRLSCGLSSPQLVANRHVTCLGTLGLRCCSNGKDVDGAYPVLSESRQGEHISKTEAAEDEGNLPLTHLPCLP